MPAASELVAAERTDAEVGKLIGADWLIYQNLEDLIGSVRYDNSEIDEFDTSCFSGKYVTGDVTEAYLSRIESERSDGAKSNREALRRRLDGESDDGDLAAGSDDAMDSQAGVG
jgi:amidophosphoribosyltransferase